MDRETTELCTENRQNHFAYAIASGNSESSPCSILNNGSHTVTALRVTLLYTSQFPGIPTVPADIVAQGSLYMMVAQTTFAGAFVQIGIASPTVFAATAADALLGFIVWELLLWAHHEDMKAVRAVSRGQREVLCIAAGRDATDAVVVVSEAGAARLEDLAQRRTPALAHACVRLVGIPFFLLAMWSLTVAFSRLAVADACCLVVVWAPGFAHAAYAAQTWRAPSALGFKFAEMETRVIQGDEDIETLTEVENIEREAGRALVAFFFPGRRHSDGLV